MCPTDVLELVQRALEATATTCSLEGLVRDELHDERPARERGAEGRTPDHARGVDDVRAGRSAHTSWPRAHV